MSSASMWAAIAGGAKQYQHQQDQQQEDQRWQQRYEMMQKNQQATEQAKARFLAQFNPPHTDTVHTTDEGGKPIIQNREWIPPTDEEVKAGKSGRFNVASTGPDINFERLEETQRHNTETEQLRSAADQARADAAAGRLDLARERLTNAKSGGGHGKLIRKVDANGQGVYGEVKDGVFHPVEDEEGNPVTTQAWRQRTGVTNTVELRNGDKYRTKPADKIGPAFPASQFDDRPDVSMMPNTKTSPQITVVDPSEQAPLSQFAPKPAAQPTQQAGSSPNNPIPYQAGMARPPSGTYVRKPDGTVVRVP